MRGKVRRRKRKRWKRFLQNIFQFTGILAMLSIAGTVGAVECDMELMEGIRMITVSVIVLLVSYFGFELLE